MDAPTAPSSPTRKSLLRRIRWSTWLVALLATGVMVIVEIPGRRTGPTTYAHGWPCAYLERDYQPVYEITKSDGLLVEAPSSVGDVNNGRDLESDDERDQRNAAETTELWANAGESLAAEEQMSPWALTNIARRQFWYALPDALIAILLVAAVAGAWQRWRSRRRFRWQFRLRTLLIGVPIVALACGRFVAWRGELRAETELHEELARNGPPDGFTGQKHFDTSIRTWQAPPWLPESLAKILAPYEALNRITTLELFGDQAIDANIPRVATFRCLKLLRVVNSKCTAAGLKPISELQSLTMLELPDADVSDAMLAEIAKLKSLTALSINCEHVTAQGIRQLANLPRLKYLRLVKLSNEHLTDSLSEFPALEGLVVEATKLHNLTIRRLPRLVRFGTEGDSRAENLRECSNWCEIDSLSLESLPALRSMRLLVLTCHDLRLDGVPELREVEFDNGDISSAVLRPVSTLPTLESLAISDTEIDGADQLTFESLGRLRRLLVENIDTQSRRLSSIRANNLPNLETLRVDRNSSLRSAQFGQLPRLKSFVFSTNPLVHSIDVNGMPNLQTLELDPTADTEGDTTQDAPVIYRKPTFPTIRWPVCDLFRTSSAFLWPIHESATLRWRTSNSCRDCACLTYNRPT